MGPPLHVIRDLFSISSNDCNIARPGFPFYNLLPSIVTIVTELDRISANKYHLSIQI